MVKIMSVAPLFHQEGRRNKSLCNSLFVYFQYMLSFTLFSFARRPLNMTGKESRVRLNANYFFFAKVVHVHINLANNINANELWGTLTCKRKIWGILFDIRSPIQLPSLFSISLKTGSLCSGDVCTQAKKTGGDINWRLITGLLKFFFFFF